MKSIFDINPDCKSWSVEKTNIPLKAEFGKEKLLKVTYGEGIVTEGTYPMWVYMRESTYTKLLSGVYLVHFEPGIYSRFTITDKAGVIIPALAEYIY